MNNERLELIQDLGNEPRKIGFQSENRDLLIEEIARLKDLWQKGKVKFLDEQQLLGIASLCVGVSLPKKKPRPHPASQPPSTYKTVPVI